MRLPLIVLALLTTVAIAACNGQVNVDIVTGTGTPSVAAIAATPLSAPTVVDAASPMPLATSTPGATRTPRAPAATKSPIATPTSLDIDGQALPVPADAKETKNILPWRAILHKTSSRGSRASGNRMRMWCPRRGIRRWQPIGSN